MCRGKVLGKAGRGRGDRGRSLDSFEGCDAWERRGRVLLEIVVVMVVMVAANIGQSVERGKGCEMRDILVMVMGVRLGLLGATTHRREPAGTVFVEPGVVFLELSALSPCGLPLGRHLPTMLFLGDTIRILPSKQVGGRIRQLSSQGHGA